MMAGVQLLLSAVEHGTFPAEPWSAEMHSGERGIREIRRDDWIMVRYEKLVKDTPGDLCAVSAQLTS
jgi:hypothetical protein